jgi:small redox-active disulfide protein 2
MKQIQILGIGCPKCSKLQAHARSAAAELGLEASVDLITDMDVITRFEVLMLPALVVDGQVRMVGKVPAIEEIKRLLRS